jgi:hypothetical protein
MLHAISTSLIARGFFLMSRGCAIDERSEEGGDGYGPRRGGELPVAIDAVPEALGIMVCRRALGAGIEWAPTVAMARLSARRDGGTVCGDQQKVRIRVPPARAGNVCSGREQLHRRKGSEMPAGRDRRGEDSWLAGARMQATGEIFFGLIFCDEWETFFGCGHTRCFIKDLHCDWAECRQAPNGTRHT